PPHTVPTLHHLIFTTPFRSVLAAQRVRDVGHRHAVRGQALRVDPHAHRVLAVAADHDAADAVQALELLREHVVRDVRQLERAEVDRKSTRLNSSHQIITYAV